MDASLMLEDGTTKSANITIVPLGGETEPSSALLILDDITEGKRLQNTMRRFMSQEVVDQVLAMEDDLLFGSSCEATVLFADIRGFTSLAETLAPRQTMETLNEVFAELVEAVSGHGGVLDKFLGDAIMAVYGAPLQSARDPDNAVKTAHQMMRQLATLNHRRRESGLSALGLGIGIATGEVIAGTVGSQKRMEYTVIGDSVNLAARLQDLTKVYGVSMIISEPTARVVDDAAGGIRELDLIRVRGRTGPSRIFQLLEEQERETWQQALQAYEEGRQHLERRDWASAVAAFQLAASLRADDRPSALMVERGRTLLRDPPPGSWDGVWPPTAG